MDTGTRVQEVHPRVVGNEHGAMKHVFEVDIKAVSSRAVGQEHVPQTTGSAVGRVECRMSAMCIHSIICGTSSSVDGGRSWFQ